MSVEFVDTNVLIYSCTRSFERNYQIAGELLTRLTESDAGAISTQVLIEFYSAATRKLKMSSEAAERFILGFEFWPCHSPAYRDVMNAIQLQQGYQLS